VNVFRKNDYLSTILIDSKTQPLTKSIREESFVDISFSFDYQYPEIPQEVFIVFTPVFDEKRPFVEMAWIRPDSREFYMKSYSVDGPKRIDLADQISRREQSAFLKTIEQQVGVSGDSELSDLLILFNDPDADRPTLLTGEYQIRIEGRIFEENADLDAELVMLGLVNGAAGTDYSVEIYWFPSLGNAFCTRFRLFTSNPYYGILNDHCCCRDLVWRLG
jgi:hypothetical protein